MQKYLFGLLLLFVSNLVFAGVSELTTKLNYKADYINLDGDIFEYALSNTSDRPTIERLTGDLSYSSELREEKGFVAVRFFFVPLLTGIDVQTWDLEAHSISLLRTSVSKNYGKLYHFSVIDDEIYSYTQKPVVEYIYSYEHGVIYFEQLTPIDEDFVFIPYVLISEQGLGAVKRSE